MAAENSGSLHRRHTLPRFETPRAHHIKRREDTLQNHAFAKAGAPYSISERDLHILQSTTFDYHHREWRALPLSVDLQEAHRRLEAFAHSGWTQRLRDARYRLWEAYNLPQERITADLFIKIFNDLDKVLFNGVLRNRVRVSWEYISNRAPDVPPMGKGLAFCRPAQWLTQHIERNSIIIDAAWQPQLCNREISWGVLIHEMLHAYLIITTAGFFSDDRPPRICPGDTTHGPLFERTCNVLAWRLAFPELTPADIAGFRDGQLPVMCPTWWEATTGLLCYGYEFGTVYSNEVLWDRARRDELFKQRRRHSL